ncbi:MAG: type II secretion system minor pseudopilin GspK [Rhodobacter sp.]|nr:type II secretion system minor pseudopilin GspK [Rhodobacter sp.]
MRRDRGVVLINALVIVLVIASVTAALLTRAEGARVRAEAGQVAAQLALYLDGAEALLPGLLAGAGPDGGAVHKGQGWAQGGRVFQIDRGRVSVELTDLQGRLNINWLAGAPDAYVQDAFGRLFDAVGLPRTLLREVAEYVSPQGPRNVNAYLRRDPALQPRGGAVAVLDQLRAVEGMTPEHFAVLRRHVAALPFDQQVNLNTASEPVLRAVLAPFPPEQVTEILDTLRDGHIAERRAIRNQTIAILESEDVDDLPFDRITVGSAWFEARLAAELDGRTAVRRVVLQRDVLDGGTVRVRYRWAEYD